MLPKKSLVSQCGSREPIEDPVQPVVGQLPLLQVSEADGPPLVVISSRLEPGEFGRLRALLRQEFPDHHLVRYPAKRKQPIFRGRPYKDIKAIFIGLRKIERRRAIESFGCEPWLRLAWPKSENEPIVKFVSSARERPELFPSNQLVRDFFESLDWDEVVASISTGWHHDKLEQDQTILLLSDFLRSRFRKMFGTIGSQYAEEEDSVRSVGSDGRFRDWFAREMASRLPVSPYLVPDLLNRLWLEFTALLTVRRIEGAWGELWDDGNEIRMLIRAESHQKAALDPKGFFSDGWEHEL